MEILYNKKNAVFILFCLLIAGSCTIDKRTSDIQDCYDVESLKEPFKYMADISVIPLTKELEFNTKNLSEIKTILGEPIEEYMDTFRYGSYVESRNDDLSIDRYYYYFPDTLWEIPRLIVHKCVWGKDNKDITLFFANDCNNGEQPFWGYVTEYDDDYYIPLRSLPEKELSVYQAINKRGKPIYKNVDTVLYGVYYQLHQDIYALRDVPKATIHEYRWYVDDFHSLVLVYLENDDKNKTKPVWGMLCHNAYFDYE